MKAPRFFMAQLFFTSILLLLAASCEQSTREFLYVGQQPPDTHTLPDPEEPVDPPVPPAPPTPEPEPEPEPPPSEFPPDPPGYTPPSGLIVRLASGLSAQHIEIEYTKGTGTPDYGGTMLFEDGQPVGLLPYKGGNPYVMAYPDPRPPGDHVYRINSVSTDGTVYRGSDEVPYSVPNLTSIRWDAPTTNVDGSPLVDLSHYDIFVNGTHVEFSKTTEATIGALRPGDQVTVKAVDSSGNASEASNVLVITEGA